MSKGEQGETMVNISLEIARCLVKDLQAAIEEAEEKLKTRRLSLCDLCEVTGCTEGMRLIAKATNHCPEFNMCEVMCDAF